LKRPISIVLAGIGGYGNLYVDALLDNAEARGLTIAGAVDPFPGGCRRLSELRARDIPIFDTLEAFYKSKDTSLTVISSPIHFHKEQSCLALSNGSDVLCEKPVAASIEEAKQMIITKEKYGKFLAIGYQWSYSRAILTLKDDIMSGRFGKPKSLKTIVLWPRNKSYYARKWAGKIKDEKGRLILDSVASNAAAHFLHNMFFILGDEIDKSDIPVQVKAELYRANDIENFDTTALYVKMKSGADIYYYASHAILENYGPVFEYVFEYGTVLYDGSIHKGSIRAELNDGTIVDYGDPNEEPLNKLWISVAAIRGESKITCPVEAATPHLTCIEEMHRSIDVIEFPTSIKHFDANSQVTWIEGLSAVLLQCYADFSFPSEIGARWAKSGNVVYI